MDASMDFIEVYETALDPQVCAELIHYFEASPKLRRGATAGGVDTKLKDSWDITINDHPEWQQAVNFLNDAMLACLMHYVRKYPFVVLAPTKLDRMDAAGNRTMLDRHDLQALPDEQLQRVITQIFRPGTINLQRYFADEGGYPYWHCETLPKNDDTLHRVLLWAAYLNDGFQEGETEFFYQQRKITPKTGAMVIAPAYFTHTHRGNQPKGGNKYLATSWILHQPAAKLYADPTQAGGG